MLRIILKAQSKKGQYRIVLVDSRYPCKPIDHTIGYINKQSNICKVDMEKLEMYVSKGAKLTDSLNQIIEGISAR